MLKVILIFLFQLGWKANINGVDLNLQYPAYWEKAKEIKPQLVQIVNEYRGNTPIYVFTAKDRKNYRMPKEMWVDLNSDVVIELIKSFGEENVKIVE